MLAGHREWLAIANDCAGERRAGGSRELDGDIAAEERLVAGNEHRLEVAGAGHEHRLAALGFALHQYFVPRAEHAEVPLACAGAHGVHEALETLTRDFCGDRPL